MELLSKAEEVYYYLSSSSFYDVKNKGDGSFLLSVSESIIDADFKKDYEVLITESKEGVSINPKVVFTLLNPNSNLASLKTCYINDFNGSGLRAKIDSYNQGNEYDPGFAVFSLESKVISEGFNSDFLIKEINNSINYLKKEVKPELLFKPKGFIISLFNKITKL